MKPVYGWWFCKDNVLPHRDGRKVTIGSTHIVEGEIIPCQNGLHASVHALDALSFATGVICYRVKLHGVIVHKSDKCAASHRTYIRGGGDISETLRKFACMCALDVIHLWDAPPIVIDYLKSRNENIRIDAGAAAWSTAISAPRSATWSAYARDAAYSAAGSVAWAAAKDAARDATIAARDATIAAGSVAWAAAKDARAAREKQNKRLHRMLMQAIRER